VKVIVSLSGGMDSTVLLASLLAQGHTCQCLTFNYGQKHGRREIEAAAALAIEYKCPHHILDLRSVGQLLGDNALMDSATVVPEGHYADKNMQTTVVPNRNMIMLSIAIGCCINEKYDAVAYAAHAGDHSIYPDCRPAFVIALSQIADVCHYYPVPIWTPFLRYDKTRICRLGHELHVPFGETWSCYKGQVTHCGKCGTCVERREAFRLAEVTDPTVYGPVRK